MNNTKHMTELRVWRQCVYCTQQLWQKTTISHHCMTSVVRDTRQFWSQTFTLVQKFSIQLQLPFPITVVEENKFQNFLRYTFKLPVASTCVDCQLCGTTSPSTAMEKVLELSTLSFSRLFVSFTNSFIPSAALFLGNVMSFKDPISCDYKLAQLSSHFLQRPHLMWLQTWSLFITIPWRIPLQYKPLNTTHWGI